MLWKMLQEAPRWGQRELENNSERGGDGASGRDASVESAWETGFRASLPRRDRYFLLRDDSSVLNKA